VPAASGSNSFLNGGCSGRLVGKYISARLDGVTVMTSNPSPAYRSLRAEKDQLAPQILVLQLEATAVAPAKPLPSKDKEPHSVDQQFRVRAQFDSRAG
jgi:hypothetical protein